MVLVETLKNLCDKRGISIQKLERELKFGHNTIYKWVQSSPSIDKVQKIAEYFNVTIDYLIYGVTRNPIDLKNVSTLDLVKEVENRITQSNINLLNKVRS